MSNVSFSTESLKYVLAIKPLIITDKMRKDWDKMPDIFAKIKKEYRTKVYKYYFYSTLHELNCSALYELNTKADRCMDTGNLKELQKILMDITKFEGENKNG